MKNKCPIIVQRITKRYEWVEKFTELKDAPKDYTWQWWKVVAVKETEDWLEFIEIEAATWNDTKTVKVNNTDTTDWFLEEKLVAWNNIELTTKNDWTGNLKIQISVNSNWLDADTLDWLDSSAFAKVSHTHSPADISPQWSGSWLDADTVDWKHATDFADVNHSHNLWDLNDVDTTWAINWQVLWYTGTNWAPISIEQAKTAINTQRYMWFKSW